MTSARALAEFSDLPWLQESSGVYHLGLFSGAILTIREVSVACYEVYQHVRGVRTHLGLTPDLAGAVKLAESLVSAAERSALADLRPVA
jgi:hypothetical protein